MNEAETTCPKCGGAMELGYMADYSHGAVYVGHWNSGRPYSALLSVFDQLRIGKPYKQGIPMGVFRCQECGFLEFYAREEFHAK